MIEVLVVLAIITTVVLFLLMAIPRGRESARFAGCQSNLFHIGVALATYDQTFGCLPYVGPLAPLNPDAPPAPPSPLRILLESFQLPDLNGMTDPKKPPPPQPGGVPGEMAVPGFVCASDGMAAEAGFRAPISYRAVTGDGPRGNNGPFAPGRKCSLSEVEAASGLGFTAGFSERLLGGSGPGINQVRPYQIVAGPLTEPRCAPAPSSEASRTDAGSSWRSSDYRSTLYNHGLPPNGKPSCIAAEGATAFMGAASGHERGVNVLRLDGSVSLTRFSIDFQIWSRLATIRPAENDPAEAPGPNR